MVRWLVIGAGLLIGAVDGRAHRDVHEQIERITRLIEAAPTAELHLRRGELHRQHEDHGFALADFDAAERLDPGLAEIQLARGETLYATGRLAEARAVLDGYLGKNREAAQGYLARARVLAGATEPALAVADYDRAIRLFPEPQPEHYLERAAALSATGRQSEALAGLEEAISRLGGGVTLQLAALDLEAKLGRIDAAVARLDGLIAGAARKEWWQSRKGDILQAAGRFSAAHTAYGEALASIAKLPAHLRATRAVTELETRARSAVAFALNHLDQPNPEIVIP